MNCPLHLAIASVAFALLTVAANAQVEGQLNETKKAVDASKLKASTYYIQTTKAFLRSGPSEDYYPCDVLTQGKAVEAYHQTDDGWLAIAPPEGSFSWILAKDAYLLPGGRVIEITTDNAVSWIGTKLGTAKQFRWQIRLNRGEQLAVLGERTTKDSGTSALWYKVAPPSGEFRWIKLEAASQSPPKAQIVSNQPDRAKEPTPAPLPAKPVRSLADNETGKKLSGSEVRTAAAQMPDDVFGDNTSYEGEVVDGQIVYGDELLDGEVIIEPDYHAAVVQGEQIGGNRWDGWHAFDVPMPHIRIPFLQNLFTPKPLQHDPLNHDPFSLSMAKPLPTRQRIETVVTEPAGIVDPARRRHTPWRDPRSLREQRIKGRPNLASVPSRPTEIIEKIATRLSALQSRFDSTTDGLPLAQDASNSAGSADSSNGNNRVPSSLASFENRVGVEPSQLPVNRSGGPSSVNWYGAPDQSRTPNAPATAALNVNQLENLTAELSEIVTGPVENWRFETLTTRVEALIESGSDPVTRGKARLLLERIQKFQDLGRRTNFTNPANSSSPNRLASSNAAPPVTTASYSKPNGQSLYDATGWLVPVHSAVQLQAGTHRPLPGQPSFALADDRGRILVYLTTVNGLRLDSYINKAVGVHGLRGYLPQLQAGHIQASRITELR